MAIEPGTYAHVDENGRLDGIMPATVIVYEDGVEVERPNVTDADIENGWFRWELQAEPPDDFWNYLLVDGVLVYSEAPVVETASADEVLTALFAAEPSMMQGIPDDTLSRMAAYMVAWEIGETYETGDLRQYERLPYRCLQAHTSTAEWNPADAVSLWARVLSGQGDIIPVWEQPDSTNPYMTGDKVHYPDADGPIYESVIDNNIWSPEAYPQGWQLVEGGE